MITIVEIFQKGTVKQEKIKGVQGVCEEMIKLIVHGL